MIREHYKAVAALAPAGFTLHLFDTPSTVTYPYAVLWGSPGAEQTQALAGPWSEFEAVARLTYVGANYEACLIVAQAFRTALNRAKPTVAGRHCHRLKLSPLMDAQPDREVTITGTASHPVFCVDELTILSEPI